MVLEAFLSSIGVTRRNRYFDDCLQEGRLALESLKADATPAYKRQAVKWAVYNFLNKQLAEDYRVFKVRFDVGGCDMEDRIVERIAQRSEYKELTSEMTPFERLVYVLTVSSPLDQAQIADTLEVSVRTVRRTLEAAREKLALRDRDLRDAAEEDARIERAQAVARKRMEAVAAARNPVKSPVKRRRQKQATQRDGKKSCCFGEGIYLPNGRVAVKGGEEL